MSNLPAYKDPNLSTEDRLSDLMRRMTLEEMVGQLLMLSGHQNPDEMIRQKAPGAMLNIPGGERQAIELSLQTRLGIPLLVAEDCIHGHALWKDATVFPTQLAMACSWNPDLLEKVARASAREIAVTGVHWTFSPVLCLTRDLRWGRVGETFGEDPHLVGTLGLAMIKGYQGEGLDEAGGVLANAKHFAGYSETQGGRDSSEADLSRRKLRSYFLPPFEAAARSGCATFMTGYQAIDGVPVVANRWLLRDVLREEWAFEGIAVTDWDTVGALVRSQKVCRDIRHAAALALKSGNDMIMATPEFFEGALEAVSAGMLSESDIEEPCRRILALKFKMGLFENPRFPDPEKAREVIACDAHRALNLEMARQSAVLLRNAGVLPLSAQRVKQLAVVGPFADDDLTQLGDWSLGCPLHGRGDRHSRTSTITVLDGIRQCAPEGCRVVSARGCSATTLETEQIAAAVDLAAHSDVAVVVIGDALDYVGERCSTATLELQGAQIELVNRLHATGTPLVVVLMNSKPLVLPRSAENAAAILEVFNPGMAGGLAAGEILWGMVNPSGKLCVSIPRHVGQQPAFYSQVRGQHGTRYADLTQEPLFPFGFGLSYTNFQYDNLNLLTPVVDPGESARIEIDITNTGNRAGDEVVQLYISHAVTSVTWVDRELKDFRRVPLEAGEKKRVSFEVPHSSFSLVDSEARRVVEPGLFRILVGPSSRPDDLLPVTLEIT